MNPEVAEDNGVILFNPVILPNDQHVMQAEINVPQSILGQVSEALQKFFKGEPKALGVTQILIGLIQMILAIVLRSAIPTLFSTVLAIGLPYWGGVFFIISGSLSVAAHNKAKMYLVKGSRIMNNMSSLVAFLGICLLCVDLRYTFNDVKCEISYHDRHYGQCMSLKESLENTIYGIEGVLLVLMLLEFCISISTALYGCIALWSISDSNMQSAIILQNEFKPETNFIVVAPPAYSLHDQYRSEANFPSEPAPAYTENTQCRLEANFPSVPAPVYTCTESSYS